MSEPAPIPLPEGLWSQPPLTCPPSVSCGRRAGLTVRTPAKIVYDYTPGIATTRFLRAIKEKRPWASAP